MTNTSVHYIELLSLREIPLEKNVGFQMQIHEKTASGEPSKIQFVLNHLKIDLFLKPLSLMMWQKDSIVWLKYKAPGHKQSPFKRYELEFNSEFDCELCISLLERLGVPPPKRLTSKPSTTASSNKTAANRFPISTQQESQVKNLWSQPMPPPLETLFCSQQHSYSVDPIPAWSDSLVNSLDSATAPPAKLGSSQLFVDSQHVPDLDSQKLATLKQTNPQSNSQSFQSLNTLVFASSQKRSVGSGAQVETALKKAKLDFSFESDHDYIMEKVIEKRRVEGQVQYKIKWFENAIQQHLTPLINQGKDFQKIIALGSFILPHGH